MNRVPMTKYGAQKLASELAQLEKQRPELTRAIEEARKHGDLKENAEYHAAKDQQGFVEERILRIKEIISNAQIIDISTLKNEGVVVFGVTVKILNLDTEEESVYQIVGEHEANIKEKKISVTSPIARALVGKSVGDEVEVRAPGGVSSFEIISVDYK